MAVTITANQTYQGTYLASHTFTDVDVSGSDTCHLAFGFNRNPASDVTSWTSEGNTMSQEALSVNANVCAVQVMRYLINNATTTTVCNTPSFKLQAGIVVGLAGVDQTTPITGTPSTSGSYGASATASYTGTSGNLLLVSVSTQSDKTFTASSCTTLATITHSDASLGSGFVGYVTATGSSQTIGATWTGSDNWRMAIVEIKASGAATPVFVRSAIII